MVRRLSEAERFSGPTRCGCVTRGEALTRTFPDIRCEEVMEEVVP